MEDMKGEDEGEREGVSGGWLVCGWLGRKREGYGRKVGMDGIIWFS